MTTQAPHIIRAAVAMVAELPEHMIRIVSPDLGGGFGNKVPVYPGYVVSKFWLRSCLNALSNG
ncbi:MAG: hypothetical protein CM1200mP26_12440 [Acidimicrobiales bacterium]|nr:MAG: hypothetical protein CM1200mP26_12440 [Acidimicrobiales bacterium]